MHAYICFCLCCCRLLLRFHSQIFVHLGVVSMCICSYVLLSIVILCVGRTRRQPIMISLPGLVLNIGQTIIFCTHCAADHTVFSCALRQRFIACCLLTSRFGALLLLQYRTTAHRHVGAKLSALLLSRCCSNCGGAASRCSCRRRSRSIVHCRLSDRRRRARAAAAAPGPPAHILIEIARLTPLAPPPPSPSPPPTPAPSGRPSPPSSSRRSAS